jgi:hypothetical protein
MLISEHLLNDLSNSRLFSEKELRKLIEISYLEGIVSSMLENKVKEFKKGYASTSDEWSEETKPKNIKVRQRKQKLNGLV